jgi:uncharacterized membrane protein YgcG
VNKCLAYSHYCRQQDSFSQRATDAAKKNEERPKDVGGKSGGGSSGSKDGQKSGGGSSGGGEKK